MCTLIYYICNCLWELWDFLPNVFRLKDCTIWHSTDLLELCLTAPNRHFQVLARQFIVSAVSCPFHWPFSTGVVPQSSLFLQRTKLKKQWKRTQRTTNSGKANILTVIWISKTVNFSFPAQKNCKNLAIGSKVMKWQTFITDVYPFSAKIDLTY